MINSKDSSCSSSPSSANGGGGGGLKMKYKGVRKRAWGKWVSEIRLPNSRERIWLGSYDSPDKAARAFDAATFCLRGRKARFNFPDQIPDIPGGRNLTPPEIQEAASKFANETTVTGNDGSTTGLPESSGGDEMNMKMKMNMNMNEGLLDDNIGRNPPLTAAELIDLLLEEKPVVNGGEWPEFDGSCFDSFDEFNEEYFPPPPSDDSSFDVGEENVSGGGDVQYYTSQHSFLWDF